MGIGLREGHNYPRGGDEMIDLSTGIITRACGGGTVKETVEIIKNMGPYHKGIILAADKDARMSDNLLLALDYINTYGYDTEFLI